MNHQPRPVVPTAQLSMAAILSQQQEEKDTVARVREENAKRSLQDIQAEQEFQQWWEMEEQRYRVENGLLTPAGEGRRGKGRGKGPGRDRADDGKEGQVVRGEGKSRGGARRGRGMLK